MIIIIQQIVTLSKYGHDALDICQDLGCFVINLLNNKTIILLNLAEYRLILVSHDIPRDFAG